MNEWFAGVLIRCPLGSQTTKKMSEEIHYSNTIVVMAFHLIRYFVSMMLLTVPLG